MEISFGYSNPLKTEFRKGTFSLSRGAYGDKLSVKNASLEHIKPKSKGGKSEIANFLLVSKNQNWSRGNQDFDLFIKEHPEKILTIQEYLNELRGVIIDGINYVKVVVKTLNREVGCELFK